LPVVITCLIATTLMASGPILASAVATAGVRQALREAGGTTANVRVTAAVDDAAARRLDRDARRAIARAMTPPGATVRQQLRSGSFALDDRDELVRFAWAEGVTDHVAVEAGRWPAGNGQVAVPAPVAAALGWSVGDRRTVTNALTDVDTEIEITAVFRVTDPAAPQWWGQPPVENADWQQGGFVIYGPLLTDRATMTDVLGADAAWWTAALAVDRLEASDVDRLRRAVVDLASRRDDALSVDTDLPALLDDAARRLLSSRAGTLSVVLQLFLLAIYALALAARLVVAERDPEVALLRSRGMGSRESATLAAGEALLIAAPATVAGPLLARAAVGLLDEVGALARAGLVLDPSVSPAAIVLAVMAGLAVVVALTVPALAATRDVGSSGRRQRRVGLAQRAGVDLVLLAVAALGYWQLRRAGGPLAAGVRGRLGVDPLLVAAPALSLLAGAVLTLRAVPVLAGLAERMATAGRHVVPALGAWQIARRPRTYARAVLLPLLALALGLFAVSFGRTWDAARAAQAVQRVGADVRVVPDATSGLGPARLSRAYRAIDGVAGAVPTWRDTTRISNEAGEAEILALDAAKVEHLVVDPAIAPAAARMAERRPRLPAIALGDASEVSLRVEVTPLAGTRAGRRVPVDLLLSDGHGLIHRLPAGDVQADGTTATPRIALRGIASPAAIVGIELRLPVDAAERQSHRVTMTRVGDPDGAQEAIDWVAEVPQGDSAEVITPPTTARDGADLTLRLNVDVPPSAGAQTSATVRLVPGAVERPATLGEPGATSIDVLITERLGATLGVGAGDSVPLRIDTLALTARVARVVPAFPTLSGTAAAGGVVMDLGTLAHLSFAADRRTVEPTAWLLDVDGDPAAVARRLTAAPLASDEVLDRAALTARLRQDPVALGVIAALSLGFATAAALAALGFVVTAIAAARERLTEFALLRAVGLSARQLGVWLTLEQCALLAITLTGGVVVGAAMSWLILPYTVTDTPRVEGTAASAQIVWVDVMWLVAFLLTAVLLSGLLLARQLRHLHLGSTLRAGEQR